MLTARNKLISSILFSLVGILGVSVLFGWILDIPELYRVARSLAPMQFNNALCFLLLGASGILLLYERKTLTIAIATLGAVLAAATLVQYPLNIDLGIDLFFFNTDEIVRTANPGRMAPNSALGHVMGFLAIILAATGRIINTRIAGVLGVSVLTAGATSLLVYGVDPSFGFNWGTFTKMAVHTSLGFVLAGIAIDVIIIPKLKGWVADKVIKRFYIWPYLSVLLVGTFLIEVQIPQNVATGLLYAVVVALAWFGSNKRNLLIVASFGTAIIIADIIISKGGLTWEAIVVNRSISIISAWFAALVLYYFKSGNERLEEREALISSVLESSGEGILLVNNQMKIQMANAQLEKMFGYAEDELHGKPLETLIPSRYLATHKKKSRAFVDGELTRRKMGSGADLFGIRKDGSEFPVEVGLSSFILNGETFVTANVSDITQKVAYEKALDEKIEELHETQVRFRAIFDNTYQFIGLLEPDGTLVEANQTALNFGGITIEQARGQNFADSPWFSLSAKIQNQLKDAIIRAANGEFIRYDVENLGGDGTIITVDFSLRPIFNEEGNVIYLVPEGRNISDRIALEKKLKVNEKLLQQFVKNTPNAVAMFNNNLEYVVASDAWYKDYGIEGKEIIGHHHYEIFPEIKEMPEWQEVHQRALKGEVIRNERDHFEREDGSTNWLRYVIQPWTNESDEIGGIIMFTEVITEQVELQLQLAESEKRFNLAVQGTTAGVWDWLDIDNDIQWWSPRFYELLGLKNGEIKPSLETFSELLHPDDRKMTFKMVDRHFIRRAPFIVEYRLKHTSGKYRWFLGSGQALWNEEGKPTRMVGTIVDIHARKMAEEAEVRHARDLSDKNKQLEEFAYIASHDLQEPIRTISSFVELFREMYSDKLDDQAKEFLHLMDGASARSQKLISDLLEYSRIGRSGEMAEVDLQVVVKNVITDLSHVIRKSKAQIEFSGLPKVFGYPTDLRLLFQNLITNAIKFRNPDSTPKISISVTENDDEWEFSVSDNGIGIDEKYFEQIFVVFKRLHGRSEYEGTGIGLANCKKIAEIHGGRIWVESKVGNGSTFKFTLAKQDIS